jgi:hypothetical protein
MTARILVRSLLLAALVSCTTVPTKPPRIDASTPAAFDASWRALVATLNSEQETRLNTAILLIGATKFHNAGMTEPHSFGPETLRSELDGKTYEEILKAAAATGTTIGGVRHHDDAT